MDSYITTFYWDFYGPMSAGTAEHFKRHLDGYFIRTAVSSSKTGIEKYSDLHCAAWCTAAEEAHSSIIDGLKPHRGTRVTVPADCQGQLEDEDGDF